MGERAARVVGLVETEPIDGVNRALVVAAAVLAIGIVRVVDDTVTGVSLGVFYILPVAVTAILCTGPVVVALAVAAAVTWSLGDPAASAAVVATNSAFRSVILLFIVLTLRALGDAARRARRSERRSQEFLALVAHQLRTPTATASATAQALLAEGGDAEHEEAYLRISRETQRIGQLVSATLRYVRLDQDPHPRVITDLATVCQAEVVRQQGLAPHLEVSVALPDRPLAASVSADGVTEALSCLLDNARRHAKTRISVDAHAAGDVAVLTVTDDGPGMSTAVADRAFEPFVALDGSGGTGLGLAIARRLTEASGGAIDYGLDGFTLRFPLLTR